MVYFSTIVDFQLVPLVHQPNTVQCTMYRQVDGYFQKCINSALSTTAQAKYDAILNWTVWASNTHSRAERADRSFLTSRQQTTRLRNKVSVTSKKY